MPELKLPVVQPTREDVGEFVLGEWEWRALDMFRKKSVYSIGSERTRHLYRDDAFGLGFKVMLLWFLNILTTNVNQHLFLMHVFLTFSLLHEAHISPTLQPSHRRSLAFHWYHATALFKNHLSSPSSFTPSLRDALWASSMLLGAAAFAHLDDEPVHRYWPLKEPDEYDLDWLKMSDGKEVVWAIAQPEREDSVFHLIVRDRENSPKGTLPIPPSALPPAFYQLFDLHSSTASSNPYHIATSLLAQLLPLEMNSHTTVYFMSFLVQLDPRYKKLLMDKDPRAMALLAWWYAKVSEHQAWWMQRRAVMEGRAICVYLARYYESIEGIEEVMEVPRMMLGLDNAMAEMGKVETVPLTVAIGNKGNLLCK